MNNEQRITFNLTPEQAKIPLTLHVGVTITYNNGRPFVVVNAGKPDEWKSKLSEPSDQPKQSRGITRGTYRGNNDIFSFDLPATSLHAGANTIDLRIESGTKSYDGFLSPNVVFDAIDLVTAADAQKAAATAIKR
ncbi:MAG: polysaccharide lyase family protein [Tepidisphaeraceae bacterium]